MNRFKKEKYLFQENRSGYGLILLYILFNTLYTIVELNSMKVDNGMGITVFTNIIISLIAFLSSVKLKRYFINWTYTTFALGVFQYCRIIFIPKETTEKIATIIKINPFNLFKLDVSTPVYNVLLAYLIVSGLLAIVGSIISFNKCLIRNQLLKQKKNNQVK